MDRHELSRLAKDHGAPVAIVAWVLGALVFLSDALSKLGPVLVSGVVFVTASGWVWWVHTKKHDGAIVENFVAPGEKPRRLQVPYDRSYKVAAWLILALSTVPLVIALWPVNCPDDHRTVVVDPDDPELTVGVAASPDGHGDAQLLAKLLSTEVANAGTVRIVTGCQVDIHHEPPDDSAFGGPVDVKVWRYLHESVPVWGYRFAPDALPGGVWEDILVPGIDMQPVHIPVLARRTTVPLCLLSVGLRAYAKGNTAKAESVLSDAARRLNDLLDSGGSNRSKSVAGDRQLKQARAIAGVWHGRCLLDQHRWSEAATAAVKHADDLPSGEGGIAALAHCIAGSSHFMIGDGEAALASATRSEQLARLWRDETDPDSEERLSRNGLLAVALHLRARAAFSTKRSLADLEKAGLDVVASAELSAMGPGLSRAQILISKCSMADQLFVRSGQEEWRDRMSSAATEALEVLEGLADRSSLRWSRYYLVARHNAGLVALHLGDGTSAKAHLTAACEYEEHGSDPVVSVRRASARAQLDLTVPGLRSAIKDISAEIRRPGCPPWFVPTARIELARAQLAMCLALALEHYRLRPEHRTPLNNRERASEIETLVAQVAEVAASSIGAQNALKQQAIMSSFFAAFAAWLKEEDDAVVKAATTAADMKRAYEAGWFDPFKDLDPSLLDVLVPGWR